MDFRMGTELRRATLVVGCCHDSASNEWVKRVTEFSKALFKALNQHLLTLRLVYWSRLHTIITARIMSIVSRLRSRHGLALHSRKLRNHGLQLQYPFTPLDIASELQPQVASAIAATSSQSQDLCGSIRGSSHQCSVAAHIHPDHFQSRRRRKCNRSSFITFNLEFEFESCILNVEWENMKIRLEMPQWLPSLGLRIPASVCFLKSQDEQRSSPGLRHISYRLGSDFHTSSRHVGFDEHITTTRMNDKV